MLLLIVDVHGELWQSEAGAEAKQVLCGEPVPSELAFSALLTSAFN